MLIPAGILLEIKVRAGRFLSAAMQLHFQLAVLHSTKFYAWKVYSVCNLILKNFICVLSANTLKVRCYS